MNILGADEIGLVSLFSFQEFGMKVVFHDSRPGHVSTWTIVRTIRHCNGDLYEVEVLEKTPANPDGRMVGGRPTSFTLRGGVVRWVSNGAIPDLGIVREHGIDNLEGFDRVAHEAAYDKRLGEVLSAYRASQPAVPSAEELCEMRATWGEGAVVEDVITGRRVRL